VQFVGSLAERGLVSTLDGMGGLSQVRTRQVSQGRPGEFKIEVELGEDLSRGIKYARYTFALKRARELMVAAESLEAQLLRRKPGKPAKRGIPNFDTDSPLTVKFKRRDSRIVEWSDVLGPEPADFDEDELLLYIYGRGGLRTLVDYLRSWRVFNIDAMLARQSIGGADMELDRHGSNIVTYVSRMLNDASHAEQLLRDLQEAVPYIESIHPDRILTFKTLRFREKDTGAEFQLPEVSDGTIRLLGLVSVLRQPDPPAILVVEEPENALHPHAIRSFLRIAREVALAQRFSSQIFLTSHSPAVMDEFLSIEARRETDDRIACFVTRRTQNGNSISPAPQEAMRGIAENLGAPSDFQREGAFEDEPSPMRQDGGEVKA
jgi:predicted ATPase